MTTKWGCCAAVVYVGNITQAEVQKVVLKLLVMLEAEGQANALRLSPLAAVYVPTF